MTTELWDPDQALLLGAWDTDLEGCCSIDRYGVVRGEMVGEPLDVALAQEETDVVRDAVTDDQWVLTDDERDALYGDDDLQRAPEELAMHVVEM